MKLLTTILLGILFGFFFVLVGSLVGVFLPSYKMVSLLQFLLPNFLLSTAKSPAVTCDQACFQYIQLLLWSCTRACSSECSPALSCAFFFCLTLCLACSTLIKLLTSRSIRFFIIGQNYKLVDGKLYWCFNTSSHNSIKKSSTVNN